MDGLAGFPIKFQIVLLIYHTPKNLTFIVVIYLYDVLVNNFLFFTLYDMAFFFISRRINHCPIKTGPLSKSTRFPRLFSFFFVLFSRILRTNAALGSAGVFVVCVPRSVLFGDLWIWRTSCNVENVDTLQLYNCRKRSDHFALVSGEILLMYYCTIIFVTTKTKWKVNHYNNVNCKYCFSIIKYRFFFSSNRKSHVLTHGFWSMELHYGFSGKKRY